MRRRLPAVLLLVLGVAMFAWSALLLVRPGGPATTEWMQTILAGVFVAVGAWSLGREVSEKRLRWVFVAIAAAGALVVIGLTADATSSRTWVRLGWALLLAGYVGSLLVWGPVAKRGPFLAGVVLGLVVIAAGAGITFNCDPSIQRSWCNPNYEQEEALLDQVSVQGELQRVDRIGGSTGPALAVYQVPGDVDIPSLVTVPDQFSYVEEPVQGREVARASYRADEGRYAHCVIQVRVEPNPGGGVASVTTRCQEA